MSNFEKAHPMGYGDNLPNTKVYAAEQTGPPLQVRPTVENPTHVAFELQDYLAVAARDLFGKEEVPIFRFALHASDARWLCVHLIHALAQCEKNPTGIAHQLEEAFERILDENRWRLEEDNDGTREES